MRLVAVGLVNGSPFSPFEIVALVTRVSADILRWGAALGTLEAGKIADHIGNLTLLS